MTENTAPKLTKSQKTIVDLMLAGWQLGVYKNGLTEDGSLRCRLQKGGVGRGGETQKVSTATFRAMKKLEMFVRVGGDYRFDKYDLNSAQFPGIATAAGEPAA